MPSFGGRCDEFPELVVRCLLVRSPRRLALCSGQALHSLLCQGAGFVPVRFTVERWPCDRLLPALREHMLGEFPGFVLRLRAQSHGFMNSWCSVKRVNVRDPGSDSPRGKEVINDRFWVMLVRVANGPAFDDLQ